jgi:hypothetical protein
MENGNIKKIIPKGELDYISEYENHEKLSKKMSEKKYNYASILMTTERLAEELWENPDYMHVTHEIGVSQVQYEARKRLGNKYFGPKDIERIFIENKFPGKKYNYKEDLDDEGEKNRSIEYVIEDKIFHAQEMALYDEIIEEFKNGWRYKPDENSDSSEDPVPLSEEEFIKVWEKKKWRYFLPTIITSYDRVMHINEPFDYWDSRNPFQQWFLIHNQEENKTYYSIGGSGSSGQREQQGRWAHTFMTLSKTYNIKIPTFVLFYDKYSKTTLETEHDDFYTINIGLTGNYHVTDHERTKKLFENRLYYLNYETSKLKTMEGNNEN